jgi:lipid-A-disaccharide synthase-like uncharacterized protein
VLFVLWELRAETPMLPMRFFGSRAFSAANISSLFMFFGMFGSIFLLAQFLQTKNSDGTARRVVGRPFPQGDP